MGFPCGSADTESACNVGDLGLIPGLGRSPEEGKDYPLQCSCLEHPRDGGAWWAAVYGVARLETTEATWQRQQQTDFLMLSHQVMYSTAMHFMALFSLTLVDYSSPLPLSYFTRLQLGGRGGGNGWSNELAESLTAHQMPSLLGLCTGPFLSRYSFRGFFY